jgi:galactitol-specific phosphotransferase system IIB component
VFLEGTEEVEGVCDKRPFSNQIEHLVVDEVDELVKDVNPISLKARLAEDMEGDEMEGLMKWNNCIN